MRKMIYIVSTVLVFALGWLSHLMIRGEEASDRGKNPDQDGKHVMPVPNRAIELQTIKHKVIYNSPFYQRDVTDGRYCVWTEDQGRAMKILKEFGADVPEVQLGKGEVLAVFLDDRIMQVLIQIVHNKTADQIFADYADSGTRKRLRAPQEGKKYTHVTAVVFTPISRPGNIGMRSMVQGDSQEIEE